MSSGVNCRDRLAVPKDQIDFLDLKQYLTLSAPLLFLLSALKMSPCERYCFWAQVCSEACVGVCVKDLSRHPDEEPAPREMTGNSKRVREGGVLGEAVGKTWWFISRISVLRGKTQ